MQLHVTLQERGDLKHSILLIPVILLLTVSCSLFQSDIDSVSDMLPRDTDLPGWERISPPAEYRGRRIKRYKEEYYNTGIERLSTCIYELPDSGTQPVTVEVARYDSVLNSYGFFSRIAGNREFSSGTESEYYDENYAIALRGEYTVYVFTGSKKEGTGSILKNFIKSSLKYIEVSYSREKLTDRINILKFRNRYGIIYSVNPVEQQEGIDRIFITTWRSGETPVKVFTSERDSFADAYRIFRERLKKGYIVAESGGVHTAFKKESDGTFTFISVYGKWIYGCWSSPDIETGKKIIDELKMRLIPFITR